MKFTWADVLIFIVGTTLGILFHQWMKDVPDWDRAFQLSYNQITHILLFCFFVKFFGTSKISDTIESSIK